MKPALATLLIAVGLSLTPRAHAEVNLWPLLEVNDTETTVLYPFYVDEPRFKMIFPLYYRTNSSRDTHLLWPLIKFHDGKLVRAAPFYFRDNDNYTFFPVIRQTEDYTLWFIPPTYIDKDGDFSAVVPFYLRSNDTMFIFPNTYWHRDAAGEVDHWCFWPFITSDQRHSDYFRFLTYIREIDGDSKSASLFPVFHQEKDSDSETFYLFPSYRETTPTRNARGVFPLFYAHDGSYDGGTERERDYLWPIYHLEESRNTQGEITYRHRRFLIFSDTRHDGRRTMRVLGIPISERIE